jgi:hypothetical protein
MSKSNPFNLPPPWNAGYALPQNVIDEGIERRAFTTEWAPRGSFDDPAVGTAGYAVPAYIKEEGYGRGAFVTRYAPRGTYYGPKIPHWLDGQAAKVVARKPMPDGATQLQILTLAGLEEQAMGSAPLTAYSHTSATALINTVRMMPDSMRTTQLRAMLDQIDPGLYARAEELAKAEAKVGVTPLIALERGLAAAMSVGLGKELVELGRGKRIGERTQLGGIVNLSAMGASDDATKGVQFIHVGPFLVPMTDAGVTWKSKSLTEEQVNWLRGRGSDTAHAYADAGWRPMSLKLVLNSGQFPLVKFTLPGSSVEYGLYISGKFYEFGDYKMEWRRYKEPKQPEKKGWWKRAWQWVKKAAVVVVNAVKDAAKWVAKQGCKLMKNPLVAQGIGAAAGAAVGSLTGGGAVAGAKLGAIGGAAISGACNLAYGQKETPEDAQAQAEAQAQAQAQATAQAMAQAQAQIQAQAEAEAEAEKKRKAILPILLIGSAGVAAFLLLGKTK